MSITHIIFLIVINSFIFNLLALPPLFHAIKDDGLPTSHVINIVLAFFGNVVLSAMLILVWGLAILLVLVFDITWNELWQDIRDKLKKENDDET